MPIYSKNQFILSHFLIVIIYKKTYFYLTVISNLFIFNVFDRRFVSAFHARSIKVRARDEEGEKRRRQTAFRPFSIRVTGKRKAPASTHGGNVAKP